MSQDLHQFLDNTGGNNFTERTPRPPVGPGEENELHSNKSSSSHKSINSNKSAGSANGGATPRRSQKPPKLPPTSHTNNNLSVSATTTVSSSTTVTVVATSSKSGEDEHDAPLGFEPEGSVDDRPDFTESPAYLKWGESLDYLLEDPDGVDLFKTYLTRENSVNLFEFYFAWKCLQNLDEKSDAKAVQDLARAMYKVFCKSEKKLPCISAELKDKISVQAKREPKSAFDCVKDKVFEILNREFYLLFFKSDIYKQYVQALEGSPKEESSAHSSGSPPAQTLGLVLETVHEDSELDLNAAAANIEQSGEAPVTLSLTAKNVRITERLRMERKPEEQAGFYLRSIAKEESTGSLPPNPYHTYSHSYLPISAIDSERQSLSSEALTDDTHSITDSSVDGFPQFSNKRSCQRYYKKIRTSAQRNPEAHSSAAHQFLPPNNRLAKVSNLAETDPAEFARVLSERLQRVLDEQLRREMVRSKLNAMSEDEATDDSHSMLSSTTGGAGVSAANSTLNQLLSAIQNVHEKDAEAQDILDMHCSRIWKRSGQHTPSKSPRAKSPEHQLNALKKLHTASARQMQPHNISSARSAFSMPFSKPSMVSSSKAVSLAAPNLMDNSYPQTTFPGLSSASYAKSNSRHGLATFSSKAEQQYIFKPLPSQPSNNQKVVEWISKNEEIMHHANIHGPESDKSSVRRSQRSVSTSASPRVSSRKSHMKGLVSSESKRSQDDKHSSSKAKSLASNSSKKTALSRSAGDAATSGSGHQTLTQRKGIKEPPQIKVAFFLLDEPIPYSLTVSGSDITLARFKELITKKGNYRYFFKKATDEEFGHEVPYVLEEITDDSAILPKWESKVVGHVKKIE